jgi:hypothetical protein
MCRNSITPPVPNDGQRRGECYRGLFLGLPEEMDQILCVGRPDSNLPRVILEPRCNLFCP